MRRPGVLAVLGTVVLLPAVLWACASFGLEVVVEHETRDSRTGVTVGVTIGPDQTSVNKPAGTEAYVGFTDANGNLVGEVRRITIPSSVPIPPGAQTLHVQPKGGSSGGGGFAPLAQPLPGVAGLEKMRMDGARPTRVTRVGYPLHGGGRTYSVTLDLMLAPTSDAFGDVWEAIRPVVEGGAGTPVPEWLTVHHLVDVDADDLTFDGTLRIAERTPFTNFQMAWNGDPAYATLAHNSTVTAAANDWYVLEVAVPALDVILGGQNLAAVLWENAGHSGPDGLEGCIALPQK